MLHSDLCAFIPKETPVTPAVKSCAGCWGSYSVSPSAFPSVPQSVSAECPRTQPSVSSQAATPHPVVSDSIYRLPTPAVFRNTADLSPELQICISSCLLDISPCVSNSISYSMHIKLSLQAPSSANLLP